MRQFSRAELELSKHLAQDPHDTQALSLLTISLIEQRKLTEAVTSAKQAIASGPGQAFPFYLLAHAEFRQEKTPEAERNIQNALRLDPAQADFYSLLGEILNSQSRFHEAVEASQNGLTYDPENVECHNVRSLALLGMDKLDQAYDSVTTSLELGPDDSTAHLARGMLMLRRGQVEEATASICEALRLYPQSEAARLHLLECIRRRHPMYGWLIELQALDKVWGKLVFVGVVLGFLPFLTIIGITIAAVALVCRESVNLLIRWDPATRRVLTDDEVLSIDLICAGAISCLIVLCTLFWSGKGAIASPAVFFFYLFAVLPFRSMFYLPAGIARKSFLLWWVLLSGVGLTSVAKFALAADPSKLNVDGLTWGILYIVGCIASAIVVSCITSLRSLLQRQVK